VITSGREQPGRRSHADDSLVRGLEGFESWSLLRGAAGLSLWPPNADRVCAITALIQALPLPSAAADGKTVAVADWRAWLSGQDSRRLHEVVPDGYYDSVPAVEARVFATRMGLLTGFLESADLHLELWVDALITGLEEKPDEYVSSAVRLVMAGAEISNMVIWRAALSSGRWPDHSLEGKIGVPSEDEYERLCSSVEFTLDDFAQNTVEERDLTRLLATAQTPPEDRHLKPLVSDGRRYLLASPADLHQATLTQAVSLALRSPVWMTVLEDWRRRAMNVLLGIASDMEWVVEAQEGSGVLWRFDTDKLAAVELLLAPVDPLSAPTVGFGAELERARQRLQDRRARDSQVELGLVVYVGDGRPAACALPQKTESPFGPWLLSLGELRLLGDALRLDPLALWRLLLRAPSPPWPGGADLVDVLGLLRRLDESRDGMDVVARDGTEYLHQRARFMTGRHLAPSPDPPGWVTVSRWKGTSDVKIFAAEAGFAPFALLGRGPRRFCWVVANAPVKDRYDLLAALTQMIAFWAARLLEAGWLAAPAEVTVDVAMRVLVNFDERPGATLVVAPYRGGARVLAGMGFLHMLCKADNDADRMLVAALVTSTRPIDDEPLRDAVDSVVEAGRGTFMIWPSPELRRADVELDPPELVLECDRRQVGYDLAPHILGDTQVAVAQDDGAQPILHAVNKLVVELLDHELQFSCSEVLLDLVRLHERACVHENRLVAALPARAELPESSEVFFGNFETTPYGNIALRGLIERVAACPPTGRQVSSRARLIRLRALAERLVEWGTASDALHAGLATARVAIGTSLGCLIVMDGPVVDAQHAVMSRLAESASALIMVAQRNRWRDAPGQASELRLEDPVEFDDPTWRSVDVEMSRVWGFSLDEMLRALRALSDHAEGADDKTAIEETGSSRALVREATRIPTPQVDLILASLTLTRHDGYDLLKRDFKPWRANREHSYLRRPLVELADGRLAWGALHTLQTIRYVVHLIETGRLSCSGTLRRAVGTCSQQLDRDFEQEVEKACKELGWETRRNVRKLDKKRIERDHGEDLGDLDVLAWDRVSGRVWMLDAKRISPSIVPIDMRREARSLAGHVEKHIQRLRWIEAHPLQLIAEIGTPATGDSWVVKAALVSQLPLVGAHLSSMQLPIWWLNDMRRHLHL
jgi:hypothetical protein